MSGLSPVLFQLVLVVQPELFKLVVFSQKYCVPAGLPLAVQLARMLVWVTLEKAAAPGGEARVYLLYVPEYAVWFASPFLAKALKPYCLFGNKEPLVQ